MRILIFHGYLLAGTGSNVYNARLAQALVGLGHEVHLLCQDRHPERLAFVEAAGDWDGGELRVERLHGGGRARATVYRPDIGSLLPVYVADRYEGVQARPFAQCSDAEIGRYIDANVAAVAELLELVRPEVALANHLVMGPVILARGLKGEVRYAVKIHGSALEYTVKPEPERFLPYAREGLAGASGVLAGSRHTAASLLEALGEPQLAKRTRLGPPGVDVQRFAPRTREQAVAGMRALVARVSVSARAETDTGIDTDAGNEQGEAASTFRREHARAADALARLDPGRDALVAFVGKLIVSKGIDLLLASWPLVLEREPHARLVVVGFGAYRAGCERLIAALANGDLETALTIARAGRALEDPTLPPRPLRHLLAFLESLQGAERERYVAAAGALRERVVLTGRLEHEELEDLLPACEALVVPSTFPESFGMVAAEGAACGALPVSAAHSGLAEVSEALARALPPPAVELLSFTVDDRAVRELAGRLITWLQAGAELRDATRTGLVAAVRERWSWQSVARTVIAAAKGELEQLERP